MAEDNKYYVVEIYRGWYFQRFDTLSINKKPDYYMGNDINQAARMDRESALKVARMYGGEVIEREGGLYESCY